MALIPPYRSHLTLDPRRGLRYSGVFSPHSKLRSRVATKLPVYAVADAEVIYSEHGHTGWVYGIDTPNSILLKLNQSFKFEGRTVTHV